MDNNIHNIGGELELYPSNYSSVNYIIDEKIYYFTTSGRCAFKNLCTKIGVDSILVPSFICPDFFEFIREITNQVFIYRVLTDLSIDYYDVIEMVKKNNIRYILTIDYFGLVNHKNTIMHIKEEIPSLVVIQDLSHTCIQILKGNFSILYGDYYFASLRKLLPVPDGGIYGGYNLISNVKYLAYDTDQSITSEACKLIKGIYLKYPEYHTNDIESLYLQLSSLSKTLLLDECNKNKSISKVSYKILCNIDVNHIALSRRKNYEFLRNLLYNYLNSYNLNLASQLDEFSVPYMLPVLLDNKDERNFVRDNLVIKGIYCSIIWNIESSLLLKNYSDSIYIGDRIICLPIDQRYNFDDMTTIYDEFINCIRHKQ